MSAHLLSSTFSPSRRFEEALRPQITVATPIQALVNGTWERRGLDSGTGTAPGAAPSAAAASYATSETQTTNPQNTHSTAFLSLTVTGRAIVTSLSGPVDTTTALTRYASTTAAAEKSPFSSVQGAVGGPQAQQDQATSSGDQGQERSSASQKMTSTGGNALAATAGSTPDISNLIGQLVSAADQAQQSMMDVTQPAVASGGNPGQDTQQRGGATSTGMESSAPRAVVEISGNAYTAAQLESLVVLAGASTTMTVAQGVSTTFDGQTAIADNGGGLQTGTTSLDFTSAAASSLQAAQAQAEGHTFTPIASGSSYILQGVSTTQNFGPGAATTLGSQMISISASNAEETGGMVVNSRTSSPALLQPEAVITAGGRIFTAVQSGSFIIVEDASSAFTIANAITASDFEGQSISIASTGGMIVVDGSSTVRLSTATISEPVSTTTGLGDYINTVLNFGTVSSTTSELAPAPTVSKSAANAHLRLELGLPAIGAGTAVLLSM